MTLVAGFQTVPFSYQKSNLDPAEIRGCHSSQEIRRIRDIDAASFEVPLDHQELADLQQSKRAAILVAECDHTLVGFAAVAVCRQPQLLRLAVGPEFRRQGFGSQLLAGVLAVIRRGKPLIAVVSEYADGAHLFLRKHQFQCERILRGQALGTVTADAYLFSRPGTTP